MAKYGTNKDISDLLEKVEKQGWRIVQTRTSHLRAYSPDGITILTVSSSRRKPMALRRLIQDFQRAGAKV